MARLGLAAWLVGLACLVTSAAAAEPPVCDLLIRGGTVYDGTGAEPRVADVAVRGERIAAIGDLADWQARQVIDAQGLAVAPGFINVLSWANTSLLVDGRGESDIRQGVTLELFGEGWSMGPLNPAMRRDMQMNQGDLKHAVEWTTLAEYLSYLARRGVAPNVASLVGATTVRIHEMGYEDRPPTKAELDRMCELVRREMQAGAMGLGTSLIYAPAFYAQTDELIALARVAAQYDGIYFSHVRSEGNRLEESVDELIRIAREASIPAEIYHLKAAGRENWPKLARVIEKIEAARAEHLPITADIYPYTAASTGLNASMPPWVQEGGFDRWRDRLQDPQARRRVAREMRTPSPDWENYLLLAGSADRVLLADFKNPRLKHLTGKTLADVARQRKVTPEEAAMDLVIEDGSRVTCVYFVMDEPNIRRKLALPWTSFGSDATAPANTGVFLKSAPHPRTYGCFARVLGKYVRDEQTLSLAAAVHKMSGLPAANLGLRNRGRLAADYYADVVIFDPAKITDHATYEAPHQYATGMRHVLVNGAAVLRDGESTGAKPGQVVWGPGKGHFRNDRPPVKLTPAAEELHRRSLVFDGHNDLPWELRTSGSSSFERLDISKDQPTLHTDIPRLKRGNLGAQYWSVYVPADTAGRGQALLWTLEQIDLVHAMIKRYPETFELAGTAADIERIHAQGKIASLIGVEGGHSIENSLTVLRRLYERGARYMTLTHSDTLAWADSATDKPRHAGLSPFGEEVVREMNRLGMLVDLSHVSPDTMHDALRVSRAPVIFSHSSARTVADHVRNVPDDVLRKLPANGGVVMVNYFSGFVEPEAAKIMAELLQVTRELRAKYPDEADLEKAEARWLAAHPYPAGTIHHVVDHIDHIVRVAGIDHVGLGSDYDGVSKLPAQLEDVSSYPLITQELLNRGYVPADIQKILGQNALRALREAEQVAKELKKEER